MVLLLAVLVVGGIAWLLIAQPWTAFGGSDPDPAGETTAETPSPSASASGAPDDAEGDASGADDASDGSGEDESQGDSGDDAQKKQDADEPEACEANAIKVEAVTDKGEYGTDEKPELSMTLKNTGDVDCTMNVGTTKQVFTVLSGGDVWWRSTDCQKEPSDMVVTLEAGKEVSSAEPIVWDRTRSGVDSCGDEQRSAAASGGASYHLRVAIGNIESESTRQFILR